MKIWTIGLTAALVLGVRTTLDAAIFFGPSPYLSSADIPAGFYLGGSPSALEDFEDGLLGFGISASAGIIEVAGPYRDSVDIDVGGIDGFGIDGRTFVSKPGDPDFIEFSFTSPLPTAAGLVWTDGVSLVGTAAVTFEAFGPGMTPLGSIGPFALNDGLNTGQTAEDRFFGVQDPGGILALRITDTGDNFEVDHVQYGNMVPEPTSLIVWSVLGALGITIGWWRRRRAA